jgi:hypothetical protein
MKTLAEFVNESTSYKANLSMVTQQLADNGIFEKKSYTAIKGTAKSVTLQAKSTNAAQDIVDALAELNLHATIDDTNVIIKFDA